MANLFITLRDLRRFEEAIEKARDALRLMPHSAEAYINLGLSLQSMMQDQESVAAFNQALHFNPDSLVAKRNKTFSLLAWGNTKKALLCTKPALGLLPCAANIHFPNGAGYRIVPPARGTPARAFLVNKRRMTGVV